MGANGSAGRCTPRGHDLATWDPCALIDPAKAAELGDSPRILTDFLALNSCSVICPLAPGEPPGTPTWDVLDARKITYASKEAAVKAGHAVCEKAAAGGSYTEAIAAVQKELPGMQLGPAATVLGNALEAYCPQDPKRLHK